MEMGRIEPTFSVLDSGVDWNEAQPPVGRQPERPLLLSIAAALLIVSGLGLAVLIIAAWREWFAIAADIGLDRDWTYAVLVLAVAYMLAGVLLLGGARAGWYLAVMVLANGFLAAIQTSLFAYDQGLPISLTDGDTLSWYAKYGIRASLTLLLILYFFTRRVREFCSVSVRSGLVCIAAYVAVALAAVAFA